MANFPDVVETFTAESNADVNNVGGTVIDADDINAVYALLAAIEAWVGPNTDTSAAASHEGRLKALEAVEALVNPMTTTGDTLYSSDDDGTPARLGIGSSGQFKRVVSGLPSWGDLGGGVVDTYLELAGQSSAPGAPAADTGRLYVLAADDHLYFKGPDGTARDLIATSSAYNGIKQDGGTTLTARNILNIIEGAGMTITAVDNSGSGWTDVTFATTEASPDYATANWIGGD
jgi:hypothetical protein